MQIKTIKDLVRDYLASCLSNQVDGEINIDYNFSEDFYQEIFRNIDNNDLIYIKSKIKQTLKSKQIPLDVLLTNQNNEELTIEDIIDEEINIITNEIINLLNYLTAKENVVPRIRQKNEDITEYLSYLLGFYNEFKILESNLKINKTDFINNIIPSINKNNKEELNLLNEIINIKEEELTYEMIYDLLDITYAKLKFNYKLKNNYYNNLTSKDILKIKKYYGKQDGEEKLHLLFNSLIIDNDLKKLAKWQ